MLREGGRQNDACDPEISGTVPLRDDEDLPGLPELPEVVAPGKYRCLLMDGSGIRDRYGVVDLPFAPYEGMCMMLPGIDDLLEVVSVVYDVVTSEMRVFLR